MKKMLLLIGLVFAVNVNAVSYSGENYNINTSMCYPYKWSHSTQPSSDRCFDIRMIGTPNVGWDPRPYGSATSTVLDHSGSYMVVAVDVFGVPASLPEVEFNYNKLTPYKYDHIINYNSNPAIVNGKRYWYKITMPITSGYLKVRRPNSTAIDYADQIYVK